MNMQLVQQVVVHKAHNYALQGGTHQPGSPTYAQRYSGYYSGFMDNAAERETLRILLERCEAKVCKNIDDNRPTLDDLV